MDGGIARARSGSRPVGSCRALFSPLFATQEGCSAGNKSSASNWVLLSHPVTNSEPLMDLKFVRCEDSSCPSGLALIEYWNRCKETMCRPAFDDFYFALWGARARFIAAFEPRTRIVRRSGHRIACSVHLSGYS